MGFTKFEEKIGEIGKIVGKIFVTVMFLVMGVFALVLGVLTVIGLWKVSTLLTILFSALYIPYVYVVVISEYREFVHDIL